MSTRESSALVPQTLYFAFAPMPWFNSLPGSRPREARTLCYFTEARKKLSRSSMLTWLPDEMVTTPRDRHSTTSRYEFATLSGVTGLFEAYITQCMTAESRSNGKPEFITDPHAVLLGIATKHKIADVLLWSQSTLYFDALFAAERKHGVEGYV